MSCGTMGFVRMTKTSAWRWLLPALWLAVFGVEAYSLQQELFPVSRPFYGYWDAVPALSGQPFVVQITGATPGGAMANAGIHDGDRIDLRELGRYDRVALLYQPTTTKPPLLIVKEANRNVAVRVHPSTNTQGPNIAWKLWLVFISNVAVYLLMACALILVLRRWSHAQGRYLCAILLAFSLNCGLNYGNTVYRSGVVYALALFIGMSSYCLTAFFPIAMAARFGTASRFRLAALIVAVGFVLLAFAGYLCGTIGLLTLAVDPLPFVLGNWRFVYIAMFVASAFYACVVTASAPRQERARTGWLLLPLPFALIIFSVFQGLTLSEPSWVGYMVCWLVAWCAMIAGAVAITYALLIRRVLDVQFIIGRTLVVGGVSAIVVVSFVLLEWLLGTALAHASHATGLAANAGLALILGLSMSFIHKRVDTFVDFAFFHRRHENEQSLRAFAKEAGFVTRRDALLDRTIEIVRAHTDAVSAAILLDGEGVYRAIRWFDDAPEAVDENDPVILALKAKHTPVDPHAYASGIRGDVALPMLARGRLLGVLLCGQRVSGEAYAPDEVDALAELAHGVGSALDGIDRADGVQLRDEAILRELRALREAVLGSVKDVP
jgi:hypothetical protein